MNICQAGHGPHAKKLVPVHVADRDFVLWMYDYEQYKDVAGYCTGKDDISRTIINTGAWEPVESAVIDSVLLGGDPSSEVVIDFGAHIGWYSMMAALRGYDVKAYEGDEENIESALQNFHALGVVGKVDIQPAWVDASFPALPDDLKVRLLKVDIEGNETYAVEACKALFEKQQIEYALIEITPVFNNSYPALVEFIKSCGYDAYVVEPAPDGQLPRFNDQYDFHQLNLLFEKRGEE